jgi:hypothetical protein
MAVAFAGGAVLDDDDVPDADAFADVEVEEVVGGEAAGASCAAVYDYFVGLDAGCAVGCAGGRRGAGGWVERGVL